MLFLSKSYESTRKEEAAMLLKDQLYMTVLANENSLTRAAAKLNISQPALSKWLSHLEAEQICPHDHSWRKPDPRRAGLRKNIY